MSALFEKPFLTDRFDSRGGGIDFLGMRQVNLAMLQEELIPGINNATADFGTFCLGAWIPWKFRRLCREEDFVLSRYTAFREAMEVAMAYSTRDGSPAEGQFDRPRVRIGIRHQPPLPGPLTFRAARRTNATSLYSAPLYGPALRYLGLLEATDARAAEDGTSTGIPLAADDEWTQEIVRHVENSLAASPYFNTVVQLKVPPVDEVALDDLGQRGLHPAFFRQAPAAMKRAFLQKFFSADAAGERRRLTGALICATAGRQRIMDRGCGRERESPAFETLRRLWYTNLVDAGGPLNLDDPLVRDHRVRWAVFQARQIQRTILELFLRCFELAIGDGCRAPDEVIDHWRRRSPAEAQNMLVQTVGDLLRAEAQPVHRGTDLLEASRAWNAKVHGAHERYDDVAWSDDDAELLRALKMLARWWLRTLAWLRDGVLPDFIKAGRRERLPMGWFHRWVEERLHVPLSELLCDHLFSDLIFAQHIKVALMRFDGQVQRLRFTLGDEGIIPTVEVGDRLGEHPVRMADRIYALISLLCDVGILEWQADGRLVPGPQRLPAGKVGESVRAGSSG